MMLWQNTAYSTDHYYPTVTRAPGVTCCCEDPQAHAIAALVATGMGQREASLKVYRDAERGRLSAEIHAKFHAWFPWLRGCCPVTGGPS